MRLGILCLTSREPDKLDLFIELACADYRDLLCAAEYPYSSRTWKQTGKNPEKDRKRQDQERKEYVAWIDSIRHA